VVQFPLPIMQPKYPTLLTAISGSVANLLDFDSAFQKAKYACCVERFGSVCCQPVNSMLTIHIISIKKGVNYSKLRLKKIQIEYLQRLAKITGNRRQITFQINKTISQAMVVFPLKI